MVTVNDKLSKPKRASINNGININVTEKESTQKTAAGADDLSHQKSEISTSKV